MSKEVVEAALFMAGKALSVREIVATTKLSRATVTKALAELMADYTKRGSALEIVLADDKYKMRVRDVFLQHVKDLTPLTDLSAGETKTLSVIAFYQPIKQADVIKIRGNRAYYQLRKLIGAGLIAGEVKGRSKLLTTTQKFFDYFGTNMDELKAQLSATERSIVGGKSE